LSSILTPVGSLSVRTAAIARCFPDSLAPRESILSTNLKTFFSVNLPVAFTCRPTPLCLLYCYAAIRGKPARWLKVLRKQLRVLRYFETTEPRIAAARIYHEYVKHRLRVLVWNGIGDLIPETVAVINAIARLYPEVVQKVSTRKPELATALDRGAANLYVALSLDRSEDSARRWEAMKMARHPRVFPVFVRLHTNDHTMGARIVMNAKQRRLDLPYDDPTTICPADAGQIEDKGACARCRMCFSPTVLDGRRHRMRRHLAVQSAAPSNRLLQDLTARGEKG
jgi:hypothetical protein